MTKQWKENNKEHKNTIKIIRFGREDLAKKARQRTRRWGFETPEEAKASKIIYFAYVRTLEKDSSLTASQVNQLIKDSNNKCFWCDCDIPKGELHIDHIYPLAKGGEHNINNLVVACCTCNLKKSWKDPNIFLESLF